MLALLSSVLFYQEATAGTMRIIIIPTVIAVIRLLPRLLPRIYRNGIYWLVALYLMDLLRYALPTHWLFTRLLMLLIAGGGCVGLLLFLRSRGAQLKASGPRQRFVLLTARVVCFLFAAAMASNCVGNVTLAEILGDTPIRMAYSAALIFAGAHLLMTLTVVALRTPPVTWLRSVQEHGETIAIRCKRLIRLAAIILWLAISLFMVGASSYIVSAATNFLQLRWNVGAAEISVVNLATFLAVFLSAVIFSRMLRFVLTEEILPRIRLPRGVPGAVDVLSRYGVLLLGFFIALAAAGVDLSKVTLLVSALGVGIGFGLQNVVNNFVSGLILVFEHPVQVGDVVEVGSLSGEVRRIGFRASVLRTPDGADVVIPNGELIGTKFINWTLSDRLRRISIPVNVAYGTDPNQVVEILLGVSRQHPGILAYPAPVAIFDRFADSALNFTLLCWSSVDQWFVTRSELTIAVNNAFYEARIEIPFPQQDVHIHWPGGPGVAAEPAEPLNDVAQSKRAEAALLPSRKGFLAKK